ncbi:hypothetical protein ACTXGK_12075 [Psychrobacter sp. T6-5]|uniref:hypothetical protein n=1 Tax=Psychrobacter sp. T6-5 TaxID=3457451 RepID=UPI003FD4A7AC
MCVISQNSNDLYGIATATPMDAPVGKWVYKSMTEDFGATPAQVRIRMVVGTVPTTDIVYALQVLFVIVPLVNADNHHAVNENMHMGNYINGARTLYSLVNSPL